MIKIIVVIVVSLSCTVASEISHIFAGSDHLIATSETNFALAGSSLSFGSKWRTVSVNGRHVKMMTATCEHSKKTRHSLKVELNDLIDRIKTKLESKDGSGFSSGINKRCVSRYQMNGGSISTGCMKESVTSSSGLSVSKQDDQHFTVSKLGLPDGLARMFVWGDLVALVYLDGEVLMKPFDCLTVKEQKLVKKLQQEANQAAESVMKNIEENMSLELKSITVDLDKRTGLAENGLNNELQDLSKDLDLDLGNMMSGF